MSIMRPCDRLPRLSAFNIFVTCLLLTSVILVGVKERIRFFILPLGVGDDGAKKESFSVQAKARKITRAMFLPSLRVVSPGENIQVDYLQVHIATAVHDPYYPAKSGFNLFLNGWARHNTSMSFKCCLVRSLTHGDIAEDVYTEVRSYTYHIYEQWIVDMQNAEFSCSISEKQITAIGDANFSHVTFAKESCLTAPPKVMKIIFPTPELNSVGVCLKITYGSLNPENIIEWFEYQRLMGVSKVFTYYSELSPQATKVLKYYKTTGFLEMLPIDPAVSKDGKKRGFKHPRYNKQVMVDEVMAANDCKHRMARFDYIIIMDIDEFILPKGRLESYYDILKAASTRLPSVCGFRFDSQVMLLDWGPTRNSPLQVCRYTERTVVPNYNGRARNTRWAFQPTHTYWVQNNLIHCRKPFILEPVPSDMYILFHYRPCKKKLWKNCEDREHVTDLSMTKYEMQLVDNILKLPVTNMLSESNDYIKSMVNWRKNVTK